MKKITTVAELKESILLLELKKEKDQYLLREQFKITYEALKPVNLIKNAIKDLSSDPNVKGDLLNMAISLGAGFLSKRVVAGKDPGMIRKVLGTLVQMGVSKIVSKNSEGWGSRIMEMAGSFLNKREKSV